MRICAGLSFLGAAIAFFTVRTVQPVKATSVVSVLQPCGDPCLAEERAAS
jgi:hypothetical protein